MVVQRMCDTLKTNESGKSAVTAQDDSQIPRSASYRITKLFSDKEVRPINFEDQPNLLNECL